MAAKLRELIAEAFESMPSDPQRMHDEMADVMQFLTMLVDAAGRIAQTKKLKQDDLLSRGPGNGVRNGAASSADDEELAGDAEGVPNGLDSLNKSHMSIVREVAMLSWLRTARCASFAQLKAVARPFWKDDGDVEKSERALRTQLSRLKDAEIVSGDGLGQYRLTTEGGEHLDKRIDMYEGLIRMVQPDLLSGPRPPKAARS